MEDPKISTFGCENPPAEEVIEEITVGSVYRSEKYSVDTVDVFFWEEQKIAEATYDPNEGWGVDAEKGYENLVAKKRAAIDKALRDEYELPNPPRSKLA